MMEKTNKKVLTGAVVSDKMDKTITVLVTSYKKHPLYKKRVIQSKKFHAHDEENQAKEGDIVKIVECRPHSRTKRFRLQEITERKGVL